MADRNMSLLITHSVVISLFKAVTHIFHFNLENYRRKRPNAAIERRRTNFLIADIQFAGFIDFFQVTS